MFKNDNLFLFVILTLALVLRLLGINYGLPYVVGPDETRQILDAFSMGARFSLMPSDFTYAAGHKYLLLLLYGLYFVFGKILGISSDKLHFALKFLTEPYSFYLIGRILSAILGTATVFTVFKIGRENYTTNVGILAALFSALNFHLVQLSYWATSDILLVFISSIGLFFILEFARQADFKSVIAASFFVGLAISSKLQGVVLIVPLAVALLLTFYRDRRMLKIILISFLLVSLASLIGNAQYLMKCKEAAGKLREVIQASQLGISSAPLFRHNILDSTLWYFKELVRQDGLMGLIFCLAGIYALIKFRNRINAILLVSLFSFLVFFSRLSLRYVYYGALILPVFSLLAAKFINDMYANSRVRKGFVAVLTTVVILFSLADVLFASLRRCHLDTRQQAKTWIEEHIPKGSTVAVDWSELNVPLESTVPFMVRTGNALSFYESLVPVSVRNEFRKVILEKRKYYGLIPVIYEKRENFWPEGISDEVRDKIAKSDFARILYSRFNFLNLDELKDRGARYLVISSYAYSHFLIDNEPDKTELFNPYLKEDTLINNRQAPEYNPATNESILFFLSKRARDFYLPILNQNSNTAILLKEFRPSLFNLGPVVKIYELN